MRKVALLFSTLAVVGCHRFDPPPIFPADDSNFSQVTVPEAPGVDEDPAEPRRVLPGDVILLRAFSAENSEYAGLTVDDRGTLHVPLAGDVQVGGLTLSQAEERVQEAMRTLDRVVRVGLEITEAAGHMATVLGAVAEPGRVTVAPGMRLADLLAAVGGTNGTVETTGQTTPLADLHGARLVRGGQAVGVSVIKAMEGDPRHNIRIRPGDHVYIPMARGQIITVLGSVESAGIFAYRRGIRLSEVLARAGGLDERGDRTHINIVRGSLAAPLVYTSSLRSISRGDQPDVTLAAGDIVYVTEEWTAHVGEVLSRLSSLLADSATIALAAAVIASP